MTDVTARGSDTASESEDAAQLTAAILAEDAGQEEAGPGPEEVADELLPGVGDGEMGVRQVVATGGLSTIGVLFLVNLVDEFDRAAVAVLAPDIQRSLGISDTLLAVLATLGGVLVVVGAVPVGFVADRTRRMSVIGVVTAILGVFSLATGFVQTAWHLAVTRIGAGFGKAGYPAHNSVLADAYPIAGRARVFAVFNMANPTGLLLGPALAGAVAYLAGGDEGWRWAFVVLAVPMLLLAVAAASLREPERGRNEQGAVFGPDPGEVVDAPPPSFGVAFARLRKIRTFYFVLVGLGIMGFALFSFSIFFSLFLEERFGLDALERGYVLAGAAAGGLVGAPVGGFVVDRLFRRNPAHAVLATAGLLCLFGFGVVAMYLPSLPLLVPVAAIGRFGLDGAVAGLLAIVASVIPFRLRAQGYAMIGIYMFFLGAFLGALITGQLSDALGERTALSLVVPPSLVVGGAVMAYGSRFIRHDIAAVAEELREERDEHRRVTAGGEIPVLQVRNLDFSYGSLQVLFGVELDVWPGEVVALLGTNGAGKSTLLRAVSGLSMPDRGVIRLDGRTITYVDAEERVGQGVVQVPGGKAVFPSLSVAENLTIGTHLFLRDRRLVRERTGRVLEQFPVLRERIDQPAGTLSGGEQQMLAIAKGLLLEPRILMLDELSLGLAPNVVQELLEAVGALKAEGVTMLIVEQSLNVALTVADRAVFMEKGRVRFEGPAAELAERDDLARAVFLGGEERGGP